MESNTPISKRLIKSSFILIAILITIGCSDAKEVTNRALQNNLQQENSAETLPYFELTTSNGKITSEQLLADSRPEFLLFISPNWGTCVSELRKLAKTDEGLSSLANIYIVGMNPGYTLEQLKSMASPNPEWIYALPSDTDTLNSITGLTRSTKILVDDKNIILDRYRMGDWKLSEWIEIFERNS